MGSSLNSATAAVLASVAARFADLRVLVVFGSQARGDGHDGSDWDLGYLAGPGLDPDRLLAEVVLALGDDRVDLVDLARATALLRYRAARDGKVVREALAGEFDRFCLEAVLFYCDVQPVIGAAYQQLLAAVAGDAGSRR